MIKCKSCEDESVRMIFRPLPCSWRGKESAPHCAVMRGSWESYLHFLDSGDWKVCICWLNHEVLARLLSKLATLFHFVLFRQPRHSGDGSWLSIGVSSKGVSRTLEVPRQNIKTKVYVAQGTPAAHAPGDGDLVGYLRQGPVLFLNPVQRVPSVNVAPEGVHLGRGPPVQQSRVALCSRLVTPV